MKKFFVQGYVHVTHGWDITIKAKNLTAAKEEAAQRVHDKFKSEGGIEVTVDIEHAEEVK